MTQQTTIKLARKQQELFNFLTQEEISNIDEFKSLFKGRKADAVKCATGLAKNHPAVEFDGFTLSIITEKFEDVAEETQDDLNEVLIEAEVLSLTDLEKNLLMGFANSEYHTDNPVNNFYDNNWTFSAVDNSGMTEQCAKGVLASLVKKGIIYVDSAEVNDSEESTMGIVSGKEEAVKVALSAHLEGAEANYELITIKAKKSTAKNATKKAKTPRKSTKLQDIEAYREFIVENNLLKWTAYKDMHKELEGSYREPDQVPAIQDALGLDRSKKIGWAHFINAILAL